MGPSVSTLPIPAAERLEGSALDAKELVPHELVFVEPGWHSAGAIIERRRPLPRHAGYGNGSDARLEQLDRSRPRDADGARPGKVRQRVDEEIPRRRNTED